MKTQKLHFNSGLGLCLKMANLNIVFMVLLQVWALNFGQSAAQPQLLPPCESNIYCYGPLLHTVQMSGIYNDSKYFVDMSLKFSPAAVSESFRYLMNRTSGKPSKEQIQKFIDQNFNEPDKEFVPWIPSDWKSDPDYFAKIVDPDLHEWAEHLNELWKKLGRKTSNNIPQYPNRYSLLNLKNPVIVPGGRFREVYYWDSYWTIEGLLLSGMTETAKGMLENFADLVRRYGKIPNGGRIYYTERSQPPYFISMMKLYLDYTNDIDFLRANMDQLEQEFNFWQNDRKMMYQDAKTGKTHNVYQYKVEISGPRPESYKEDYKLAEKLSGREKQDLYVELKSGAESGWDYSTRWFIGKDGSNKGDLSDINVTGIAPVDLNSLMCRNAALLAEFSQMIGDQNKARNYENTARDLNQTMADLFWDEQDGVWYDLNLHTKQKRKYFYLSNIHPMWSGCFGAEGKREKTVEKVMKYLQMKKVDEYIGGVPTSLKNSSEQWDFPNTWPPLQHLVITGLHKHKDLSPEAEQMSFDLADKWIRTNYLGFDETGAMFEKYDATVLGVAGRGGEYEVQLGFGWTNAVAMKILSIFGDRLSTTTAAAQTHSASLAAAFLLPLAFVFLHYSRRNEVAI